MSESPLELRSINEINQKFFVRKYQRGYRWTNTEVKALLDDISKFLQEFYCLQPVVVRYDKDHERYNLIDGQQRLTTIYLIFKAFEETPPFSIDYETRNTSKDFLEKIGGKSEGDAQSIIDFYFMHQAFQKIQNLKKELPEDFLDRLKNKVKVIWYEVQSTKSEDDSSEEEIFRRLNSQKIPLTNAELIKAHFLISENDAGSKNILALEWDKIENTLQKEDFWHFIYGEEKVYYSRIEYIFDLMTFWTSEDQDPFYTFQEFTKDPDKYSWEKVKLYFRAFENWYNDLEAFHLVGFLVVMGTKITEILAWSKDQSKTGFLKKLKQHVNMKIYGKDMSGRIVAVIKATSYPSDKPKDMPLCEFLSSLQYGRNNPKIKEVLLLFNILSLQKDKVFSTRFPFERYIKEQWSLEHIHAQNSEGVKPGQRLQWIKDYTEHALKIGKLDLEKDSGNLSDRLQTIYFKNPGAPTEKIEDTDFEAISVFLLSLLDDVSEWMDSLENMALLKKEDNSSLNNAPFSQKRQRILELAQSSFIPPCTQNVFLKYYSEYAEHPYEWAEEDRKDYLTAITEALKEFITDTEEMTDGKI